MSLRRTTVILMMPVLAGLSLVAPRSAHGAVPHQTSGNVSQLAVPSGALPAGWTVNDGPTTITTTACAPAVTNGIVDEFLIEHPSWCSASINAQNGIYQDWTIGASPPTYTAEWAATVYADSSSASTAAINMIGAGQVQLSPGGSNGGICPPTITDFCAEYTFTDSTTGATRPNVAYGVLYTGNVVGEAAVAYGVGGTASGATAALESLLQAGDHQVDAFVSSAPTATTVPTSTPGTSTPIVTATSTPTATPTLSIPPPPPPVASTPTATTVPTSTSTPIPSPTATLTPTATPVPATPTPTPRPTHRAPAVAFRVYGADLQTTWKPNWGQRGPLLNSIKKGKRAIFGIYVSVHRMPRNSRIQFQWAIHTGNKIVVRHQHSWITSRAQPYWDHWAFVLHTTGTYRFTGTVIIHNLRRHRSLVFHVTM